MLSGCGNEKIAETFSETSVTSAEAAAKISETTKNKITETEITVETTTDYEYVSDFYYMPTIADADFPKAEDMSGYTGNFYEWRYDGDIVSKDEESFSGSAEIIAAAKSAAKEYMSELCRAAEDCEEFAGKKIIFDYPHWWWDYPLSEDMQNGTAEPEFYRGVYNDFDGDGKRESFIIFYWSNPIYIGIAATVFVGSDGKAEALPDSVGILSEELNPVRYNGFTHMIIQGGYNNSTCHAEFYAVENGRAVHKHSEFVGPELYGGVFMKTTMAQASGYWLIFWNEEKGEYCTILGDELNDDQAEELFRSYEYYRGNIKKSIRLPQYANAAELRKHARIVGNDCYIKHNLWDYEMFRCENDSFEISSDPRLIDADERYPRIFVNGVDIEGAKENMIRLEK